MSTPFRPMDGGTVTVSASQVSAHAAFNPTSHALAIYNDTAEVAHVKTALGSSLTATTADFPVGPGEHIIMGISSSHNRVAVILAATASGNVYVTPGTGGHLK